MKRLIATSTVLASCVLAAIGFGGVTAFASHETATPFQAAYPTFSTYWTCSGVHVVNKHSVKDIETCIITGDTTGWVEKTYKSNPKIACGPGVAAGLVCSHFEPPLEAAAGGPQPWFSDYPPENGAAAIRFTLKVTDNDDGTFTVKIVAYYSS